MKLFRLLSLASLMLCDAGAADRSILELQRDMALLQDQMRSIEQRMTAIQTMLQQIAQQTSENSTKSDARIDKLQITVEETIKSEVSKVAVPIAVASAKLDSVSSETSSLRDISGETARQLTSMRSQLDEINTALKALPVAPPPPSGDQPSVQPSKVFTDATRDMNGKPEFALQEFADFVRMFPSDPLIPRAQFNIGQINFSQRAFDRAAEAFDSVVTRFPDDPSVPDAMYMKGLACVKGGHKAAAIEAFNMLVAKYPSVQSGVASPGPITDALRPTSTVDEKGTLIGLSMCVVLR
jgi:TolA-binding protein